MELMVNMMICIRKLFFILTVLAAVPGVSHAVVQCRAADGDWAPLTEAVNLGGKTITVLEDIPVGYIVYQAKYIAPRATGLTCSGPYTELKAVKAPFSVNYETTPLPLSSWTHPSGGRVYQTNVAGLGVAIGFTDKKPAPQTHSGVFDFTDTPEGKTTQNRGLGEAFYLTIIKTGPVAPGVINGASLPGINVRVDQTPGVTGLPVKINFLSFTGQLTVRAPTCKTPDVTVNLGTHEISQKFKGKGSYTDWVSANIPFECPAIGFTGYYPANNTSLTITGGGTLPAGTPTNNQLTLTLQPLNEVIDAANGIMSVDKAEGAATGVGIQLGMPPRSAESGLPSGGNVDFSKPVIWNMPLTEYPIRWPLRARYIQTADKVTPGPANGKVVFTVNYK
ncbi:fimbrial protein [Enterobacter cloacae]|uniref:fimbrial protein n=1 Tax=Enterobacter cloacae TaxID=550 RepID=UPI0034A488ED